MNALVFITCAIASLICYVYKADAEAAFFALAVIVSGTIGYRNWAAQYESP